ncbi:MAG: transcriptional regulator BetI [Xanthomonadales bacterium]|nr:transcriptional regulator BetI [Xanthomonadales bacterium]
MNNHSFNRISWSVNIVPASGTAGKRRTASKAERREQLIKATIRSIASNGLSDTTMATVSGEAGLSQGIINLHFQSKEKLLLETLSYVVDEYKLLWEQAMEKAGSDSAERLSELVAVDFHRSVCDRNKLAVWFAFWSESKARPTYRKLCAARDHGYDRMLRRLCADLKAEGDYANVDPGSAARGLAAMTEGLWLDMLVSPRSMSRDKAKQTCRAYLAHLFPRHFSYKRTEKKIA